MALSWNEIKDRAVRFSKEWEHTTNEEADAKSFLDAFFDVFGITRKKIGTFEHQLNNQYLHVMLSFLLHVIFGSVFHCRLVSLLLIFCAIRK